jgi:hypothetical protein
VESVPSNFLDLGCPNRWLGRDERRYGWCVKMGKMTLFSIVVRLFGGNRYA